MADKIYITDFMNMLFPDGSIPSKIDIQGRIRAGSYTVRDAIIEKLYKDGIGNFSAADIAKDSVSVENLESTFKSGGSGTPSGIYNYINRFKKVLDKPYFEVFKISPEETAMDIAKLEGKTTAYTDVKSKHQNLDNITKASYQSAGVDMPRNIVVVPQPAAKSRAEVGRYPKLAGAWQSITEAAGKMSQDEQFGPKTSAAFLFHNTNPMRIKDLMEFTIDSEAAIRGDKGISRPYLRELQTGEFELGLIANNGRKKKHFNSFILDEAQVNIIKPHYDAAMSEYNQKKAYLAVEGNTLDSYNAEFKDRIKYPNGQIFKSISNNYGPAIRQHFKPLIESYQSVVTGVSGGEIVRKLQSTLLRSEFGDTIAKYFTSHTPISQDIMRKHYAEQGTLRDPTVNLHAPDDIVNVHTKKYLNIVGQALKEGDVNAILIRSGLPAGKNKIPVNVQIGTTDAPIPYTPEEIQKNQELADATRERNIAENKAAKIEADDRATTAATNRANKIQEFASQNNLTYAQAEQRLFPEKRGRPSKEAAGTNQAADSDFLDDIAKEHNIDKKSLIGKTIDEIGDIIEKAGKAAKTIAPFVGPAGVAYGVGNVLYSGKEAFADIPPEEQTMPTKVVRGAAELFGKDPEAAVMGARVIEEAVSPIPATGFPRKDEEVIPFGEAMSEQIEDLFPEDFNIGGIRGTF